MTRLIRLSFGLKFLNGMRKKLLIPLIYNAIVPFTGSTDQND